MYYKSFFPDTVGQIRIMSLLGHYLVITLQNISPGFPAFPLCTLGKKDGITTRNLIFFRYPILSLVVPDRAFRV